MISVIIPSRTDEYLSRIVDSFERSQPHSSACIIVGDNGISDSTRRRYDRLTYVSVPKDPFVFSQAINLCVDASPPDNDLLVIGDDSVLESNNWMDKSIDILNKYNEYGIISPQVIGNVATEDQSVPCDPGYVRHCDNNLCFVAVLIRRAAWNQTGKMDERFVGYGYDDTDYCIRVVQNGWKLGVTSDIVVKHGVDGHAASATFRRYHSELGRMAAQNSEIFAAKWSK